MGSKMSTEVKADIQLREVSEAIGTSGSCFRHRGDATLTQALEGVETWLYMPSPEEDALIVVCVIGACMRASA